MAFSDSIAYQVAIATGTVGDIVGRIFASNDAGLIEMSLVFGTITGLAVSLAQTDGCALTLMLGVFYLTRGTSATTLQMNVKRDAPDRSSLMGKYSQSGALLGASTALVLTSIYSFPVYS